MIIAEQTAEIERLLLEVERMQGEVALYRRTKIKESPEISKAVIKGRKESEQEHRG